MSSWLRGNTVYLKVFNNFPLIPRGLLSIAFFVLLSTIILIPILFAFKSMLKKLCLDIYLMDLSIISAWQEKFVKFSQTGQIAIRNSSGWPFIAVQKQILAFHARSDISFPEMSTQTCWQNNLWKNTQNMEGRSMPPSLPLAKQKWYALLTLVHCLQTFHLKRQYKFVLTNCTPFQIHQSVF